MLIGVEATPFVSMVMSVKFNPRILGTLDRTAVRPAAELAVLHRAANINNVRSARGRINRHVVRALRLCSSFARREPGCAIR